MQKDPFHFGNWPTCPMPWKIYQQVTSLPSLITYRRHSIHCWATKIEKKKWESTWQLIESRRAAKQGKVEEKTATREIYIAIKKNVWKDKIEYTVVLAIQTHLAAENGDIRTRTVCKITKTLTARFIGHMSTDQTTSARVLEKHFNKVWRKRRLKKCNIVKVPKKGDLLMYRIWGRVGMLAGPFPHFYRLDDESYQI